MARILGFKLSDAGSIPSSPANVTNAQASFRNTFLGGVPQWLEIQYYKLTDMGSSPFAPSANTAIYFLQRQLKKTRAISHWWDEQFVELEKPRR